MRNNLLKWKYKQTYAKCSCKELDKQILFTTLCPIYSPITAEEYKDYHRCLDLTEIKLKKLGFVFWGSSVLLISHLDISKKTLEKILGVTINEN